MGVSCQREQHAGRRKNGTPPVPESKNAWHRLFSHGARGPLITPGGMVDWRCAERTINHTWVYGDAQQQLQSRVPR